MPSSDGSDQDGESQLPKSFFFKDFIYLFMRDRGIDTGRGRSKLHAGSPMWD